ncbi:hypothetical protein OG21DRAFT_532162 [Imleria badia]|nr:hypothetical protein OG21DRAFT_532162 [Imleria badia]
MRRQLVSSGVEKPGVGKLLGSRECHSTFFPNISPSFHLIRINSLFLPHNSLVAASASGLFLPPTPEHPSDAFRRRRGGDDDTYTHFTLSFVFDTLASSIRCTNPQTSPTCIEVDALLPSSRNAILRLSTCLSQPILSPLLASLPAHSSATGLTAAPNPLPSLLNLLRFLLLATGAVVAMVEVAAMVELTAMVEVTAMVVVMAMVVVVAMAEVVAMVEGANQRLPPHPQAAEVHRYPLFQAQRPRIPLPEIRLVLAQKMQAAAAARPVFRAQVVDKLHQSMLGLGHPQTLRLSPRLLRLR